MADQKHGTVSQTVEHGGSLRVGDSATGAGSIPAGSSSNQEARGDKRGVKVDAWKLYSEAYSDLFPNARHGVLSPAALQEMVDRMLATGGVIYQALASAASHERRSERDYCEACGYTDSHDPNCPAPKETTQPSSTVSPDKAAKLLVDIESISLELLTTDEMETLRGALRQAAERTPSTTPRIAAARQAVADLREKLKPRIPTFDECADAIATALCMPSATACKPVPLSKAKPIDPETDWVLDFTFLDEVCDAAELKDPSWRLMPEAAEAVILALEEMGHLRRADGGKKT